MGKRAQATALGKWIMRKGPSWHNGKRDHHRTKEKVYLSKKSQIGRAPSQPRDTRVLAHGNPTRGAYIRHSLVRKGKMSFPGSTG